MARSESKHQARDNVFPVRLPSLRERIGDVPILVWHFVREFARRMDKRIEIITAEDLKALCSYEWPGNMRELQNVIERFVILSSNSTLHLCPIAWQKPLSGSNEPEERSLKLADAVRKHILQALRDTQWVIAGPDGAAERLGVKRTTLLDKRRRLGITRPNS